MAEEGKEAVSYEMLQDLLRSERRSNKLSPVPARFWHDVRRFLQDAIEAFRVEQARDPFSRTVMMLSDQAKNAKAAAEGIWALRERKLAMLALAAPKERKPPEGITADEGMLYQRMVELLGEGRERTFEGTFAIPAPAQGTPAAIAPAAAAVPALPAAPPPALVPPLEVGMPSRASAAPAALAAPASSQDPAMAPAPVPAPAPASPVRVPSDTQAPVDLVTIRALGDIPPFVGPDMQTYLLKAGDMASVPPAIASLLVKRKKAVAIQDDAGQEA